jgi:hypothetical protein
MSPTRLTRQTKSPRPIFRFERRNLFSALFQALGHPLKVRISESYSKILWYKRTILFHMYVTGYYCKIR